MELSEKLQELRKEKGLTQEELAEALFVSRTAISKWESGRGVPNIESLKAISKFFSVSIDELLSGEEILKIADEDNKQKEKHTRDLVFGLLDCSLIMFLLAEVQQRASELEETLVKQMAQKAGLTEQMKAEDGLKGTVKFVDDAGQIHMSWENGSSLALNIHEDTFEKVEAPEKISVILVEPGRYPKLIEIEDTLEAMQSLVEGDIEEYMPFEDEVAIICNEEGKMNGMPLNRAVYSEPENVEMSYPQLKAHFRQAEKERNHTTGYIVFTADSFDKPYTEEQRTYVVSSNNKAFIEGMGGYSIYASSLDGSDKCVRLEAFDVVLLLATKRDLHHLHQIQHQIARIGQ